MTQDIEVEKFLLNSLAKDRTPDIDKNQSGATYYIKLPNNDITKIILSGKSYMRTDYFIWPGSATTDLSKNRNST